MIRNVPLGQPTVGERELQAVAGVFESGWLSGAGPACLAFEKEFAGVAGVENALATSNCGTALHLGLNVLGAGPGDEVIVGDYTFPATGHSVMWTGAKPELRAIADRHGLWLMEDAACSAGASYKGRPAGSLADAAAFSFHGRKGITAGEGGALVSPNADLIAHARKLHTYGIAPAITREGVEDLPVPEFDELGYNYRMSDVQAAIMRVQVERLPDLMAARGAAAGWYAELLSDVEGITLPVALDDRVHPWQSYVITFDPDVDRGAVALELRRRGVGCNFGTYASHVQPLYGQTEPCPVSADLFRRHLAIPMHANLTQDDVTYVAQTLRDVLTSVS